MLLEAWKDQEEKIGDEEMTEKVRSKLPRRVKKQRRVKVSNGETEEEGGMLCLFNGLLTSVGWEEYYDYIFPDDENNKRNIKILERAQKWKEKLENKDRQPTETTVPTEGNENDNENDNGNEEDDS